MSKKPQKRNTKSTSPLTKRMIDFANEYIRDRNGAEAARRAGYSPKTARAKAHELLRDERIKAIIDDAFEKALSEKSELQITAERVLEELAKVGFASMRQIIRIDADGQPNISMEETPDWALDALSEVRTETVTESRGEDQVAYVRKTTVKFHNKLQALTILADVSGAMKGAKEEMANALADAFRQIHDTGSKAPIATTRTESVD